MFTYFEERKNIAATKEAESWNSINISMHEVQTWVIVKLSPDTAQKLLANSDNVTNTANDNFPLAFVFFFTTVTASEVFQKRLKAATPSASGRT